VEEQFLSSIQCTWGSDLRQAEIHTTEPQVPEPSAFEFEMAIKNLK